jgi:hypothetical protein
MKKQKEKERKKIFKVDKYSKYIGFCLKEECFND